MYIYLGEYVGPGMKRIMDGCIPMSTANPEMRKVSNKINIMCEPFQPTKE